MAEIAPSSDALPIPSKKSRTRKPLKEKNPSTNDANILAGPISPPLDSMSGSVAGKENSESLSQPQKKKKSVKAKKQQQEPAASDSSFEKALQEMQEKLENMTLEKEKAEELLKMKEEELETRGKEQEKLQMELKKLQKLKEFKPTMNFPIVHPLKEKEQDKKKKSCPEHKRPAAPYAMWCKDHWNEMKRENPNAEFKEITNILGAKWKTISAEEKKPYEEKYQIEKEAYLKVMGNEKRENEAMKLLEEEQKQSAAMELLQQYLQFKQDAEKENKKPSKKEKDPLKPKQPASAYFLFMHERRAAMAAENNNVVEVAKVTGEEWKNMTEEEKAPYEEIAKKKKAEYLKEMEIYKQKKEEEAMNSKKEEEEFMKIQKQEALQLLKKKEKTETMIKKTKEKKKNKNKNKNEDPNKPKKPASSFLLFSKEARKNLLEEKPDINNSTLVALISVKWKELSEEERQKWNAKAAEAMEIYKKDLEEYNKSVTENNQK